MRGWSYRCWSWVRLGFGELDNFLWLFYSVDYTAEIRAPLTSVFVCFFQTAGRRSFAAPSDGAQRPASPLKWGTGWHGRAARSQLTAAPTQTALMEREYPTSSSSIYPFIHIQYPSIIVLFPLSQVCLPYYTPGAWEPVQRLSGWTRPCSDRWPANTSNTLHG